MTLLVARQRERFSSSPKRPPGKMIGLRNRWSLVTSLTVLFMFVTMIYWRRVPFEAPSKIEEHVAEPITTSTVPPHPIYKPEPIPGPKIVDNFPLAAFAETPADLPPIPPWNTPPSPHVSEKTPLYIGFTRNWRLLQQVVVSHITAGWPPEDIYVVENTGVMDSNARGLLSLQNPFFLNHTRLTNVLGVNILVTPTLLTFAQLQNFYLFNSISRGWDHHFWSHMDVVAVSFEDRYAKEHTDADSKDPLSQNYSDFNSTYTICLRELRRVTSRNPESGEFEPWAMTFFSYDRLSLVNVKSFSAIGGWDTMIPFYMGDCDMHERIAMAGFHIPETIAGMFFDVGASLSDLIVLYRKQDTVEASFIDPNPKEPEDEPKENKKDLDGDVAKKRDAGGRTNGMANGDFQYSDLLSGSIKLSSSIGWTSDYINSQPFQQMLHTLDLMQRSKNENKKGRNTWQARATGGYGEPFYRDSAGFEKGIVMLQEHGKAVFAEKWGHRQCDLIPQGLKPDDAWRVEHDGDW